MDGKVRRGAFAQCRTDSGCLVFVFLALQPLPSYLPAQGSRHVNKTSLSHRRLQLHPVSPTKLDDGAITPCNDRVTSR